MTTRPTIAANKAVSATLGAAEWNLNVLQQGNWTQEVLAGTNSDKIPGAALSFPLAVPEGTLAGGLVVGTSTAKSRFWGLNAWPRVSANLSFDGVNFNRDDITAAAHLAQFAVNDHPLQLYRAAAGANPAALTLMLDLDNTGLLTGAGIRRSSNTQITNGNTITVIHNFGVNAALIDGSYGTSSGTFTLVIGHAAADTVRFSASRTNNYDVSNSSGASVWVNTFAMI